MEITGLTAIPVAMDLRPLEAGGIAPYVGSTTSVDRVERVLVRLETAEGITGWGECRPVLGIAGTTAVIEERLGHEVVGRSVCSMQDFRMDPMAGEYTSLAPFVAAVEVAMWDAYGQSVGESLSRLLGGASLDRVDVADVLGILDPDESRQYAQRAVEAGFGILKVKGGPPNSDWRTDVARIAAMDDAVDGALEFRLDPNGTYAPEDAVRLAATLEERDIYLQYLEQPVAIDSPGTYRQLRSRLRTPIAVNEDTYHQGNLATLLRADAVDVAVVDLVPSGGILALRDHVALAAEAGVSVSHHCGFDLGIKTAAMLHVVSATPALNLSPDLAYHYWADHLVHDPPAVEDGGVAVPDGPGLGIEIDPATLERYRID